ncbi:uncharacterized protein DSM5745_08026 [Aspergillus mulundensis]|uniref:Uncharacterized protein n=1 Tax=Aspergillus mulundensis TaxID=1810919 RepID=A0A3D8R916_9EURO|nr:Uncharacterized protein DSM5745_08026 [Aspergillus mulundensis]RDW70515.1 Uncharacterized protein DSM5745_08026 [Aspergillus mulundensis]
MSLPTSPIPVPVPVPGPSLSLLRPTLALNAWPFTMEPWMYATRIPVSRATHPPPTNTTTKSNIDKLTPASVRWKADNYNHRLEQPTQFYAVALALALARYMRGQEDVLDAGLAWMYVGLRVLHSVVHGTGDWIMVRFGGFVVSSGVLALLAGRAAAVVLREDVALTSRWGSGLWGGPGLYTGM